MFTRQDGKSQLGRVLPGAGVVLSALGLVILVLSFGPGAPATTQAHGPGSIWTTDGSCGGSGQDLNQFNVGQSVWINGANFTSHLLGNINWSITGQPGSSDPSMVVASGTAFVGLSGDFCVFAYVVQAGDAGVYKVDADGKNDNYSVGQPTNTPTNTATNTATSTATNTATNTPTATSTTAGQATNTPTNTPTSTATSTATEVPTSTPTSTQFVPTNTATITPTFTPISEQAFLVVTVVNTVIVPTAVPTQQVAGVQQQPASEVAGVSTLPRAGSGPDRAVRAELLVLGLGLVVAGAMVFATGRRIGARG